MATNSPFFPNVVAGGTGQTVVIKATLSPGTVVVFPQNTTSVLAQVQAPAGQAAYIRISAESSTAIAGSLLDTPVFGAGNSAAPTVKLFATPGPGSQVTIAVVATVTSSAVTVWLTPGTGGFGP